MLCGDPVNRRLDLTAVRSIAPARLRIVTATQFGHSAFRVLYDLAARDEIGVAQPYLGARRKTEEFLRWILHEVVLLDIELAAKLNFAHAGIRDVGVIGRLQLLNLSFRIVFDD